MLTTTSVNPAKVYVAVDVAFTPEGKMRPRQLTWEDGTKYEIDRVSDVRQAAAMRAGGHGDRYTIWVNRRMSCLFFERSANRAGDNIGRWFVEMKHT